MNRIGKSAAVVALVVLPAAALATSSWMRTFNGLYKPGAESAIKKAKCAVCHVKPNGKGGFNDYGKLLDGKDPSVAALKAIETLDADKDGVRNIKEIKAGTLPGDPASKP